MQANVNDVLDHVSSLPSFPKVAARLLQLLSNPSVTVNELAETISMDASLSAKVVHLSNSSFYLLSQPVRSIKDAVFVLGLQTVKSVTIAATLHRGLAGIVPRPDVFDLTDFWKHSYATAIAARHLATKRHLSDCETLYLAGLLHDIGKLIIANFWPESWKAISGSISKDDETTELHERKFFPYTHSKIAETLCTNWQLPEEITKLVSRIHDVTPTEDELNDGIEVLRQADGFTKQCGLGIPKTARKESIGESDLEGLAQDDLIRQVNYQLQILEA
jgi:putative nucleotidyltransferase with HDIG domain